MKLGQRLWTREELILAINLYCKTPFGRLHSRNPEIIHLSSIINRTPSAVAYKLVNFASLDPSLKARGVKGAENTSSLDKEIWMEFYNHWDSLPFESEKLLAKLQRTTVEKLNSISEDELVKKSGLTREQIVKTRVNQNFFRTTILSAYNNTCCITGINKPELLIAGHISPWSFDEKNRLNPRNGLALNALHDKAFETGLITITPDYKIKVSSILKKEKDNSTIKNSFLVFENKSILLPSKFLPGVEFLEVHNKERFKN